MNPNQVSKALRQIADKLDASTNPSKDRVAADIKMVVSQLRKASSGELVIESVERVGGSDYFPDFHITGTWCGEPFVRQMSLEVNGPSLDVARVSGVDFEELLKSWSGPGDFHDSVQLPMLEAIYASPEWKSLTKSLTT